MEMEYRKLGRSGLKLSALSLGAWVTYGGQVGEDVADGCMSRAYEAGVNFFDNAEAYAGGRAEEVMGRILRRKGWDRSSYVVSSKVFWGGDRPNQTGLSRKHVVEACHAALRRLQVEYLDLYFCHRPDPATPVEETVRAMHDLVVQGKVLYWGTSEWSAQEIMEAWGVAERSGLHRPAMEQPEYNMFHRYRFEWENRHLYDRIGLGTTIWSPLASGVLTGKYLGGVPSGSRLSLPGMEWLRDRLGTDEGRSRLEKVGRLDGLARELGASLAQLALGWCLKNPHVSTVITGASRVEQLIENLAALEVAGRMTPEVMDRIEEILGNRPDADR